MPGAFLLWQIHPNSMKRIFLITDIYFIGSKVDDYIQNIFLNRIRLASCRVESLTIRIISTNMVWPDYLHLTKSKNYLFFVGGHLFLQSHRFPFYLQLVSINLNCSTDKTNKNCCAQNPTGSFQEIRTTEASDRLTAQEQWFCCATLWAKDKCAKSSHVCWLKNSVQGSL